MIRSPKDVPPPAPAPNRAGRVLALLTLVVALYAAAVSTLIWLKGSGPAASSSGAVHASPEVQALLDDDARRLRGEIEKDFQKSVQEAKDQLNRAARLVEDRADKIQGAVEAGRRSADGLAKEASTRAELLEDRVKEMGETTKETRSSLDSLASTVRALERRGPAATAPTPPAPPPNPTPPGPPAPPTAPPAPEPAPAAKAPTPGQIAANKEHVRALIADLADPNLAKALSAATELGRSGDLEAVAGLVTMLKEHRDSYARTAAAAALGSLAACDAVPALIAAILDRDPDVFLEAAGSLRKITGVDSGLSGDSSKKDRNEARDKVQAFWKENEASVRQRLGQPVKGAAPEGPPK